MADPVLIERRGALEVVSLNRPERLNAMDAPRIAAPLDRALALADEMLLTSPMGLRLSTDALNLNIDSASMAHAFAPEDRQQVLLSATEDAREAREAFRGKRAPEHKER